VPKDSFEAAVIYSNVGGFLTSHYQFFVRETIFQLGYKTFYSSIYCLIRILVSPQVFGSFHITRNAPKKVIKSCRKSFEIRFEKTIEDVNNSSPGKWNVKYRLIITSDSESIKLRTFLRRGERYQASLHQTLPFQLRDQQSWDDGNFLFLKHRSAYLCLFSRSTFSSKKRATLRRTNLLDGKTA
jgi:hypothetical protein